MIRHHLVTALRALAASPLLSAIAILGLAVGLTGAVLMALVVDSSLGYNRFFPGYERVYLATSALGSLGMPPNYNEASGMADARLIAANVSGVEAVRLDPDQVEVGRGVARRKELIYWADPAIFGVLTFRAVQGTLAGALDRPDGLVLTEGAAARWFGGANALGRALDIAGRPMIVRAVIADPPPGASDLTAGVFASGRSAASPLAHEVAPSPGSFSIDVRTYLKLAPGADRGAVERAIAPFVAPLIPAPIRPSYALKLVRVDRLARDERFHPGVEERLTIGSLIALLVLFIAAANFLNLGVALAARRTREIGVRKACGASRGQIAAQFLGEATLTVLIAACLAMGAAEWLLPVMNANLGTAATLDYARHPAILLWFLLAVGAIGLLTGAYPALLLSAQQPAANLKGTAQTSARGDLARTLLVAGQFAIVIGILIATAVIHQQRNYAAREALRVDVDQLLTVTAPCPVAFRHEVAALAGVRSVSCVGSELFDGGTFAFVERHGARLQADYVSILPGAFALFGVRPLAGSLDRLPPEGEKINDHVVLNAEAARRFGFTSPADAIGQPLENPREVPGANRHSIIAAVIPDFALTSIERPIVPTLYFDRPYDPNIGGLVVIKLAGRAIPETLAAIDRLWRATGNAAPIERSFVSARMELFYQELQRSTQLFALFAAVAVALACLGMVGLAIVAADRRTKEIGVRKAMGAGTGQVLALLLVQFSRPVLLANLVAWPVTWLLMRRWLSHYAYHVPLHAWLFPAAGLAALAVALAAVGAQAFAVARQRPIVALRYE